MALTSTPYGLRPINAIGGRPFSGSTRQLPITSGFNTAITNGDLVAVAANGTIVKVTVVGTNANPFPTGTVGIFLGCSYTDTVRGFTQNNQWPAGQVAADAQAYICDDPNALFQIQADAAVAQALMHSNFAVNQTAGDTANGNSRISLDVATAAATATIAFKLVDFVNAPGSTVGDAFTDVIVKFNPSSHAYTAGLGL
tara:strand:- start:1066 stop:1659 length:594 start_codon:yes stop_codon:yes gene_type:complete